MLKVKKLPEAAEGLVLLERRRADSKAGRCRRVCREALDADGASQESPNNNLQAEKHRRMSKSIHLSTS